MLRQNFFNIDSLLLIYPLLLQGLELTIYLSLVALLSGRRASDGPSPAFSPARERWWSAPTS